MLSIVSDRNNLSGSSFSRKYRKFYADFGNPEKSSQNNFRFLDNCIWIGCVKHSLLLRENTFHRVSICKRTVSRFQILLRENFSSWFFFILIIKYDKILPYWFKQCFWPLNMLTAHKCSGLGIFRHLSNSPFCSL